MRWVDYVTCVGRREMNKDIWWGTWRQHTTWKT